MILVPLLNPTFAIGLPARLCELRVRGTSVCVRSPMWTLVCETELPEYSISSWMPIRDMYIIDKSVKNDPVRRWALPDRVFFACGACHILAFAFLEKHPHSRFRPVWIKPLNGHTGNHIF